jgi:hypothetical protein
MILTSQINNAIVDYFSTRTDLLANYEQKGIFLSDIVKDVERFLSNLYLIKLNNYGAIFFLNITEEFIEENKNKKKVNKR